MIDVEFMVVEENPDYVLCSQCGFRTYYVGDERCVRCGFRVEWREKT